MLRDFVYRPDAAQLRSVLSRFDIELGDQESNIGLILFLLVSPDSFLWKLRIGRSIYYLYAEDYVASLDSVQDAISQRIDDDILLTFIHPKEIKEITDSSAYNSAAVYEVPESTEIIDYAVDSGYDLVFLCKSNEDSNDAYFN